MKGVFEQKNADSPNGGLASRGGYVMATLRWNPNRDADRAMTEFLDAFCGKTATQIRTHDGLLHCRTHPMGASVAALHRPCSTFIAKGLHGAKSTVGQLNCSF